MFKFVVTETQYSILLTIFAPLLVVSFAFFLTELVDVGYSVVEAVESFRENLSIKEKSIR